jgi:hypothetical protein
MSWRCGPGAVTTIDADSSAGLTLILTVPCAATGDGVGRGDGGACDGISSSGSGGGGNAWKNPCERLMSSSNDFTIASLIFFVIVDLTMPVAPHTQQR